MISGKNKKFEWTTEGKEAFNELKKLLVSPPVLVYPDYDKQFIVEVDASNYAIGGVLSQYGEDGLLHPVYYYSKSLKKAEINYTVTEKELLAIKTALVQWKHLLQGAKHKVIIYSDHRNLMYATKPQLLSPRQIRWQQLFAGFWFEIIYRPGHKNGRADVLSRLVDPEYENQNLEESSILKPNQVVDFDEDEQCLMIVEATFVDEVKEHYKNDKMAQEILADLKSDKDSSNKKFWLEINGLLVKKDNSDQVYIPGTLRKTLIQLNHDSEVAGHLGIRRTTELLRRNYYWPKMGKEVAAYVKACKVCRTQKDSTHAPYGLAVRAPITEFPWQKVQIDFITDLPVRVRREQGWETTRAGCIMVNSDTLTKMVHLVGFRRMPNSYETAQAFLHSVFLYHGFPVEITTDRGVQFTSNLWKDLMKFFHIEYKAATTSHHGTVGQVESNNKYVETYLRCYVKGFEDEQWMNHLYLAEFCYNNSVHASTQQSPFMALYNYQVHMNPQTAELVHSLGSMKMVDSFAHNLGNLKHILEVNRNYYLDKMDTHRTDNYPRYKIHDLVWLKKPENYHALPFYKLETRYYGPFRIVGTHEEQRNYKLDISKSPFPNMHPVFHVSELEPYHNQPKELVPEPKGEERIIKIMNCRKLKEKYEYLVTKANWKQDWVDAEEVDQNPHYEELRKKFQESCYEKFLQTVVNQA